MAIARISMFSFFDHRTWPLPHVLFGMAILWFEYVSQTTRELPYFRNSENVEVTALSSSVARCSFLRQKSDLAFVWFRESRKGTRTSKFFATKFQQLSNL